VTIAPAKAGAYIPLSEINSYVAGEVSGSRMVNTDPTPGSLSHSIEPL